ncbi:MAG: carboxylating nicotinate-nucleotide diphosphorylase [Candidatus Omnitrophota bacterium]|nr:carboxylating nicotinate-nucleotide diphosphorylase [Candidatus Omnitrophota bacterium]
MKDLDRKRVDTIIRFALKEDIWTGDVTSQAVIDNFQNVDAVILSRGSGVVCGMDIVERVFIAVDCGLRFRPMVKDGDHVEPDQEVAFAEGNAQSILKAERVALNFLSLLSGVATTTRRFVDRVEGTGVKIYDTRKTIPLHRYLQKYAVTVGGGHNHRSGLWDMVLIKDNHLRIFGMQKKAAESETIVKKIIKRARSAVQKNIRIEIEVETLKECEYALDERPEVIMLDNMSPENVKEAVRMRKEKGLEKEVLFEVSGGVTMDNVRDYAQTGVEIISTGSITDFIRPLDFSLEVILS